MQSKLRSNRFQVPGTLKKVKGFNSLVHEIEIPFARADASASLFEQPAANGLDTGKLGFGGLMVHLAGRSDHGTANPPVTACSFVSHET
jgi:hypothetical protein